MALFRFGSIIPTPGVSYKAVKTCLNQAQTGGLFGLINLFSGGALLQLSVFALGIMPYITSSIIVQLLTVLFRFGSIIPTPGVSYKAVKTCLNQAQTGGLFGLINLFSGGALLQLSVFALGIMPYITSSIIVQLLTVVIPRFEALKQEGQSGTAKLTQYTRYLTIGLGILQTTGLIAVARTPGRLISGCNEAIIPDTSWQIIITMIFVMTAGTAVIMWLGELITDRGVQVLPSSCGLVN